MESVLAKYPNWQNVVYQMALLGAMDKEIAAVFDVSIKTVELWKRENEEFRTILNRGKAPANAEVAASLFKCANGYYYDEEQVVMYKGVVVDKITVKRYARPNPWAAYKILSLRDREHWHDTQNVSIQNNSINTFNIDFTNISTEELMLLKRIGLDAHNAETTTNDSGE